MEIVERRKLVASVLFTAFIFTFSQFLLITAYPTIMHEFNVNATQVQWLTTAFLITTIVILPMTGYLSNKFSTKSLIIFSLVTFIIGSAVGALAPTFFVLTFSRVVQAIGAAVMLPLVQTVIFNVYPKNRRGQAMGMLGAIVNVAPASAPPVAGLIIDLTGWRFINWMLIPIAVTAIILALLYVRDTFDRRPQILDIPSLIIAGVGFFSLSFGLSNISVFGFTDLYVWLPVIIGGVTLIFFVSRQLKLTKPILELRLFKGGLFRLGVVLLFMNIMLLLSMETILPMLAQEVLQTSVFVSGLILVPGTLLFSVATYFAGNLYDRAGPRRVIIPGLIITAIALLLMRTVGMETSPFTVMVYFCVFMSGFGMILMTFQTVSINAVEQDEIVHASALVNIIRQFSMTLGIILFTTIITVTVETSSLDYQEGMLNGIHNAITSMIIISIVSIILSFMIDKTRMEE